MPYFIASKTEYYSCRIEANSLEEAEEKLDAMGDDIPWEYIDGDGDLEEDDDQEPL